MTRSQLILLLVIGWVCGLAAVTWLVRRTVLLQRVRDRVFASDEPPEPNQYDGRGGYLSQWLFVSGFRSRWAWPIFVGLTAAGLVCGGLTLFLIESSGIVRQMILLLDVIPGHVGEVFMPMAYLAPWLTASMFAGAPALVVRAARKRRVTQVEQDLPITLDLLSTLAQAGLGFDQALDRILAAQRAERPLTQEFRMFQYDLLAGRPRVEALRRMARRVEVPWFSIFASALVQAEQIGSGLAEVLRSQAHDLRDRRRERALAFAMAIPVKLLFPLVSCFLPAIMTAALGPAFYQIFQSLDAFVSPFQQGRR